LNGNHPNLHEVENLCREELGLQTKKKLGFWYETRKIKMETGALDFRSG
jgi:hypothetical protein